MLKILKISRIQNSILIYVFLLFLTIIKIVNLQLSQEEHFLVIKRVDIILKQILFKYNFIRYIYIA